MLDAASVIKYSTSFTWIVNVARRGLGKMARALARLTIAAVSAVSSAAFGAYTITPLHNGGTSAEVAPGEAFDLDIVLTSNAADAHNSAIFRVGFSEPGLLYDAYLWVAPYQTGTIWDDSDPLLSGLPLVLAASTLSGPGYPAGVVDIELSNVVPIGQGRFDEGLLTTLMLTIPSDFEKDQSVWISVFPETIASGFDVIPTTAGPAFELRVVPEPASVALWLSALAACLSRRRR